MNRHDEHTPTPGLRCTRCRQRCRATFNYPVGPKTQKLCRPCWDAVNGRPVQSTFYELAAEKHGLRVPEQFR